jgi:hypothetical protein
VVPTGKRTPKRPKTTTGSTAQNLISRFSNDIAHGISNRYLSSSGITNIAKDLSRVMSLINTEDKHIDLLNTAVSINNVSPLIQALPTVAQGLTVGTRVGNSIKVNRMDIELLFQYTGTIAAANIDQSFRYWIVRYLKTPPTNGSLPFNLSEFINTDNTGNYTLLSQMNTDTNENFQVMYTSDVHITLPTLTTTVCAVTKNATLRHECSFHQEYNGALSTNICDNMCFLVCVAMNSTNVSSSSVLSSSFRLWYIDN